MMFSLLAAVHSQITSLCHTAGKPARYAVHLGFSIGMALGLVLSTPFISGVRGFDKSKDAPEVIINTSSSLDSEAVVDEAATVNATTTPTYFRIMRSPSIDQSSIEFVYIIVFSLGLIVAAAYVCAHFMALMSGTLYKLQKPFDDQSCQHVTSPRRWAHNDVRVGVVTACILVVWTALQNLLNTGTDSLLMRYARDSELGFTESGLCWLSFSVVAAGALGRLTGMVCSRFISIKYILLVIAAGQALCAFLCLFIGSKTMTSLMLLASCFYFYRDASIPTMYAWSSHYILIYGVLIGLGELVSSLVVILYVPVMEYMYENVAIVSVFVSTAVFATVLFLLTWPMHWFAISNDSYMKRLRKVFAQNCEATIPTLYVECRDDVATSRA